MTEGTDRDDERVMATAPRYLVVILILLAGWFLRIHDLEASSLWLDEIRSFERALLPDWQAGYEALIQANHAPLYEWIVLRTWLNLGSSEFLARFPGALLSMLAISATYALATSLFQRKDTGLWAMVFVIASSFYLKFGRWVRPYALLSILLTLTIYFLWRAMATGRRRYWLAFGLLGAGALYTHYIAAFTLVALGVFVITRAALDREKALVRDWALSSLLTAVLFLPWLSSFRTQLDDGAVKWIEPLSLTRALQLPITLFVRDIFGSTVWLALTVVIWLLFAIGLLSWIRGRSTSRERWSYPYIGLAAAGTLLIVILVSFIKPLTVPRYFLGALPAISVLAAFSVVYGRPRVVAVGLGIVILAAGFFASFQTATHRTTENWKTMARYIEANSEPEDRLVLFDTGEGWTVPFRFYYQGDLSPGFLPGELSDRQAVIEAIEETCPCDRLWLAQTVKRTKTRAPDYEPEASYAGYRVVERSLFDEDVLLENMTVDLWLLEKIAD